MEPIRYRVFPKINWSSTCPRRATENHKMQLCNRLQFWIMQLPKAWYEMFYGLRSVQGISMFKCKSRCWEWRRSWWPVMRLHNWRLNAHELRKILMSVCLLVTACLCVCEAISASPPWGKVHEFLGTFSLPRKHISRPWKVMQGRSIVQNKEM